MDIPRALVHAPVCQERTEPRLRGKTVIRDKTLQLWNFQLSTYTWLTYPTHKTPQNTNPSSVGRELLIVPVLKKLRQEDHLGLLFKLAYKTQLRQFFKTKKRRRVCTVTHTFNTSHWETEAGGSVSLQPAWSTYQVTEQQDPVSKQ